MEFPAKYNFPRLDRSSPWLIKLITVQDHKVLDCSHATVNTIVPAVVDDDALFIYSHSDWNGRCQQWILSYLGDEMFSIFNHRFDKALSASHVRSSTFGSFNCDDEDAILMECDTYRNQDSQKWRLIQHEEDCTFELVNVGTGKLLEVADKRLVGPMNVGRDPYSRSIHGRTRTEGLRQRWKIQVLALEQVSPLLNHPIRLLNKGTKTYLDITELKTSKQACGSTGWDRNARLISSRRLISFPHSSMTFILSQTRDGFINITSPNSKTDALEVPEMDAKRMGLSSQRNRVVHFHSQSDQDSFKWILDRQADDYFKIVNRKYNRCLAVSSKKYNTTIPFKSEIRDDIGLIPMCETKKCPDENDDNQKWKLVYCHMTPGLFLIKTSPGHILSRLRYSLLRELSEF